MMQGYTKTQTLHSMQHNTFVKHKLKYATTGIMQANIKWDNNALALADKQKYSNIEHRVSPRIASRTNYKVTFPIKTTSHNQKKKKS